MTDLLAAVDIGTNSIHLVVARVRAGDHFDVVEQLKEMVRLGSGGGDMKRLSEAAIERGVGALRRVKQIADSADATIRAVATSAVREAENADEFLARCREAGVEVEIISGVEEARLIHLGVLQALPVFDRRLLLCDIGGGSTELLLGHGAEVLASRSFKLGAVRLTDRFFAGERLHPAAVSSCRSYVRSTVSPFRHEIDTHGFDIGVGSSGTIDAVAQMVHAATGEPPLMTYNGSEFTRDDLALVTKRLIEARSVAERAKIPGLDAKRADIMLAGALILEGVMESLGVERMTLSGFALREGVLLDTMQRMSGGSLHHLRDVSRRSVQHLVEACDEEPEHSARVARLALELFDATVELHRLDETCREYLEAAALLANVGLFISHSRHHLHSYYVIRNSERLLGFTDNEIEMIALIARYHRKSAPKPSHREFAGLSPDNQAVVRTLAALLRVAIGLDRRHEARVVSLTAQDAPPRLVIAVAPEPGTDIALELYAANERKQLLEEVFERRIDIVAVT
jgi:exopolyphosphatase/guanosine-5'-triphosphate,3'-diphosphate pyrophosphatase